MVVSYRRWLSPSNAYNCWLDTLFITILSETYVGKLPTSIEFAIFVGIFPTRNYDNDET